MALLYLPRLRVHGRKSLASPKDETINQARAIALKARPGAITDEDPEREAGGTGLRYSFDIKSKGSVQEVGIDANTSGVLENAAEGKSPD
jgi:uncharacterized membrane protein YkoI